MKKASQRLLSLDAFRGFTIASMLLVNNPGDWAHLYAPLDHAKWNGWTFTDWIFPFFVFISGIAMTMSLSARARARGANRTDLLLRTLRRGATIIAIGWLLNYIPYFNLAHVRIPGVLQRIGLCTMLTAPLAIWLGWRAQALVGVALMALYSAIQLLVPVPDAAGVVHAGLLEPGADVGAFVDRTLLGAHLWVQSKTWDPEGLLSTLPAVASQIAGLLAGHWLASERPAADKAMGYMIGGLLLLWAASIGDFWLMPINKSLWTPPYVLLMAGWACLVFGSFYWLLDAQPYAVARARLARLVRPLQVLGVNALFLFALSGLVAKMMGYIKIDGRSLHAVVYAPFAASGLAPINASLAYAIAFVAVMYACAWGLWKRGIVVKV